MKHTGGAMSPFNAWMMVKSLETLELRVRAQVETAQALAEALLHRKDLARVIYPGLKTHPQFALSQMQMGAGGDRTGLGCWQQRPRISVYECFGDHSYFQQPRGF